MVAATVFNTSQHGRRRQQLLKQACEVLASVDLPGSGHGLAKTLPTRPSQREDCVPRPHSIVRSASGRDPENVFFSTEMLLRGHAGKPGAPGPRDAFVTVRASVDGFDTALEPGWRGGKGPRRGCKFCLPFEIARPQSWVRRSTSVPLVRCGGAETIHSEHTDNCARSHGI